MKNVINVAALAAIILSVVPACSSADSRIHVSLVQLIASPEEYEGKEVMVMGYLGVIDEPYLYLTKEDASLKNVASAIRIHDKNGVLEAHGCTKNHVVVIGTFDQLDYISYPVMADVVEVVKYDLEGPPGGRREICWEKTPDKESQTGQS